MKESTRRALRTAYQVFVALVTIAPVLTTAFAHTPAAVWLGVFAGWVAAVSVIINKLEDAGLIPAWLRTLPTDEDTEK